MQEIIYSESEYVCVTYKLTLVEYSACNSSKLVMYVFDTHDFSVVQLISSQIIRGANENDWCVVPQAGACTLARTPYMIKYAPLDSQYIRND